MPRAAAVAIKSLKEEQTLAEILRRAKNGMSLSELVIMDTRVRKTANGSLLIEIPGAESAAKADLLAGRLKDILREDAAISRLSIRGELRLTEIPLPFRRSAR